jgi:hypothetical protein
MEKVNKQTNMKGNKNYITQKIKDGELILTIYNNNSSILIYLHAYLTAREPE